MLSDYSLMYYTIDGILVVTCLFLLNVDMTVERGSVSEENIFISVR